MRASQPVVIDRLEASVNSSLILKSDLARFRKSAQLRAQLDPLFGGTPLAKKGSAASDADIVDFLISERLITQVFPASNADVEQAISSIQSANRISRDALKTALKEQGFDFDEYFELIRTSVSKQNLIRQEIQPKVTISDEDVRTHLDQAGVSDTANDPAAKSFHARILVVSPKNFKSPSAARQTIERASKEIQDGQPFEEVAKRVSDDPSAAAGGDLGVVPGDVLSKEIRDALVKLSPNQVSGVLGGPKSRYFLLQLLGTQSLAKERNQKVTDEVRAKLAAVEYQRQILLWIERQRQGAFVHRKS